MKNVRYLLGAAVLLGLAAFSMSEPEAPRLRRKALEFPRYPRPHEIERREARKTLALPAPKPVDAGRPGEPATAGEAAAPGDLADPVLVALASSDELALVLEAGALRDSPIGRMLLACQSPEMLAELERFEERAGFRPLEQLDRVGVTSHDGKPVIVLSGDLASFDPGFFAPGVEVATIGGARVLEREDSAIAVWRG